MKRITLFTIMLCSVLWATSQVQRPVGNPTVQSTGWYNLTAVRDSFKIFILHDTFPARYPSVVWHPDFNFYKSLGNGAPWTLWIPNTPSSGTVTSVNGTGALSFINPSTTAVGTIDTTWSDGLTTRKRTRQIADSLQANINLKLNISDTAAMLTNYLKKSDTLNMLGGYVRSIGITPANGVSGSSSGGQNPRLTVTLGAITPSSIVNSGAYTGTTINITGAEIIGGKLTTGDNVTIQSGGLNVSGVNIQGVSATFGDVVLNGIFANNNAADNIGSSSGNRFKELYVSGGRFDTLTASRAVVTNSNKELASSATTATEIGYVNGVTSSIQSQLNALSATNYWQRSGAIISPLTAGDAVRTSGIIQSTDGTFYSQLGNGTVQAGVVGGNSTALGSVTHSFIQNSTQLDLRSRNLVTGNHSVYFQDKDYTVADSAVVAAIVTSPFQGTTNIISVASGANLSMTGNITSTASGNFGGLTVTNAATVGGTLAVTGNITGLAGLGLNVVRVSSTYSVLPTDYYIECTTGTFTVTLPNPTVGGRIFVVKNSGTGVITINATGPSNIDNLSTQTLSDQYSAYVFQSNSASGQWNIVGKFATGAAATNYWQRNGVIVSPATLGDAISTTGTITGGDLSVTSVTTSGNLTVAGYSKFIGNIGIGGTAPSSNAFLRNFNSVSLNSSSGQYYGTDFTSTFYKTSSAFTSYIVGQSLHAGIDALNTQNWTGDGVHVPLIGLATRADINAGATGTLTQMTALDVDINAHAMTTTNADGIRIHNPTIDGTGSVVANAGIRIDSITGATNANYGIYNQGPSNVFTGDLSVKNLAATSSLSTTGNLTVAGISASAAITTTTNIKASGSINAASYLAGSATAPLNNAIQTFKFNGNNNEGTVYQDLNDASGVVFQDYRSSTNTQLGYIQRVTTTNSVLYSTSSDIRMKKNILASNPTGDLFSKIKIVQFDWKEGGQHVDYGAIAQDLNKLYPDAVAKQRDPANMWGIDWSKLVPPTIKKVQEQDIVIQEQGKRIDAQDKIIADLLNRIIALEKNKK